MALQDYDKKYDWCARDPWNIQLGLANNRFNPFCNMSATYSIWLIMLISHNLTSLEMYEITLYHQVCLCLERNPLRIR